MKKQPGSGGQDWCQKGGRSIFAVYFLAMTVVYPYYAPGGYLRIGEVKYVFFRNAGLAAVLLLLPVVLCSLVRRPGQMTEYLRRMSVTDWFVYGYFVTIMLSYLCSPYKENAFLGAEGWYMGAAAQMLFVFLFFAFSRYFVCGVRWLAVWLCASAGIFLLGILNRYSIYPIPMEGQTPTFISTLGNINWFCGYWSVTAPIGLTLYWCAGKRWHRAAAGLYSAVAVLAGVVQGSDSAVLVFAVVFGILFLLSVHSVQRFVRWLELCIVFAASCQAGRVMRSLPGFSVNYGAAVNDGSSVLLERLTEGNGTLWLLAVFLLCYGMLRLWDRRRKRAGHYQRQKRPVGKPYQIIRSAAAGLAVAALVCAGVYSLADAGGILCDRQEQVWTEPEGREVSIFNKDWGNGRGTAWNCSIEAYRELDFLHKIVGVGPDCFADHIYGTPARTKRLVETFGQERLTNAHSEGLSMLLNMGALGVMCYVGFVGTALVRYLKGAGEEPLLYVCAVSLLAYTAHNTVSFQQVLNTPYFYMILGMGEGLLRRRKEPE